MSDSTDIGDLGQIIPFFIFFAAGFALFFFMLFQMFLAGTSGDDSAAGAGSSGYKMTSSQTPTTGSTPENPTATGTYDRLSGRVTIQTRTDADGTTFVPTKINGRSVYFKLDTGASITTLSEEVARRFQIEPLPDAPTAVHNTPSGRRKTEYWVMERLNLGGKVHRNVTYSLCNHCRRKGPDGINAVGLLGQNVLDRYNVTVNKEKQELILKPSQDVSHREHDAAIWFDMSGSVGDGVGRIEAVNKGPFRMNKVQVEIFCEGNPRLRGRSDVFSIPAESKKLVDFNLPDFSDCENPTHRLTHISW